MSTLSHGDPHESSTQFNACHPTQVVGLLDQVKEHVGAYPFHEALCLSMVSCSAWRQANLNYFSRRPIHLVDMGDERSGEGRRLLTQAFTACVADKDLYVQRSSLDLLPLIFPLSGDNGTER